MGIQIKLDNGLFCHRPEKNAGLIAKHLRRIQSLKENATSTYKNGFLMQLHRKPFLPNGPNKSRY